MNEESEMISHFIGIGVEHVHKHGDYGWKMRI